MGNNSMAFNIKMSRVKCFTYTSCYAPATKWPRHIVLPLSVRPSFRNKQFSRLLF